MKKIIFDSTFELGIDSIDQEHKYLIELTNKIIENQGKDNNTKNVGEIIHELLDYTRIHFKHEEEFFESIEFKDKEEHLKKHRDFIEKVDGMMRNFLKGRLSSIDSKFVEFMSDWIQNHIKKEDKEYQKVFFKSKNKAA